MLALELIIMIRAEVRACQVASVDVAHERILAEQHSRIATRDELKAAYLADVTLMWDDIAARRRKLADRLEDIHKSSSRGAG